jgi:SAM-dependent methyltransferase
VGDINGRVLDAACGFGNPYLEKLNINSSLTIGLDIDPVVKKKNRLHQKFIIEDLHNFNSELHFDCIISVNTWEHLHSPNLVLKNFFNVLSNKGIIIIISPQRWHYIACLERLLPSNLKDMAWKVFKSHKKMPYRAYYNLCSKRELSIEARRQGFMIEHFSSIEGPPIWFARIPPLFILMCLWMSLVNKFKVFESIRGTFIAVLKKV